MYDPSIGRWLTEDPLDFEGGDINLYRYVGNKPTLMTDPSGLLVGIEAYRAENTVNHKPDPVNNVFVSAQNRAPRVAYRVHQGRGDPRGAASVSEGRWRGAGAYASVTVTNLGGNPNYCNTGPERWPDGDHGSISVFLLGYEPGSYRVDASLEIEMTKTAGSRDPGRYNIFGPQRQHLLGVALERGNASASAQGRVSFQVTVPNDPNTQNEVRILVLNPTISISGAVGHSVTGTGYFVIENVRRVGV